MAGVSEFGCTFEISVINSGLVGSEALLQFIVIIHSQDLTSAALKKTMNFVLLG